MWKNLKIISQFGFLIFVIIITTCELFTGIPRDDLLDLIDDEIAWANAERLTVRVAYPPEWGVSPQFAGLGDIRKGYEFDLGFTPNPEYALLGWRAYKTADINNLLERDNIDWTDNPAVHLARITQLLQGNDKDDEEDIILLSDVSEGGGLTRVIVNLTEPITLIPFSRSQPRIIRSTPINNQEHYRSSSPISITFAAALDGAEARIFAPENIRIERRELDENRNPIESTRMFIDGVGGAREYYNTPEYEPGDRTITIQPKSITITDPNDASIIIGESIGPPTNSEITLYMNNRIRLAGGSSWPPLPNNEPRKILTWKIRPNNCFLENWNAKYKDKQIHLEWESRGADTTTIRVRREHSSLSEIPLITYTGSDDSGSHTFIIDDAMPNEWFEIWINLTSGGEAFPMEDGEQIKIWAISGDGMQVNNENRAIEINNTNYNNTASWRLNDPNAIHVLTNNINAPVTWTPVGTLEYQFKGTFYGLDNTITFPNMASFNSRQYMGFFGYLNDARINNLNVVYNSPSPMNFTTGHLYVGGIAGYAAGNTIITGCTVTGNIQNDSSGLNDVFIGGLIGSMHGQANVKDSFSNLNINVNKTGAGTIHAGGLAGQMNGSSITDSYFSGNITVTSSSGAINTGGFAGSLYSSANIRRGFARNRITVTGSSSAVINTGGIAGFADNSSINNTVVLGSNIISSSDAYRILGSGTASLADNHARGSTSISPGRDSLDENGRDGVIVTATGTTAQGFWTGRGFNSSTWDFNSLGDADRAGHPLLTGISNQTVDYENIQKLPVTKVVDPDNTKGLFSGPDLAEPGESVSFTVTPVTGYSVRRIQSADTGGSDRRPAIPQDEVTSYSFIMPNYPVTLTAMVTANTYELDKSSSGSGTFTVKVDGEEVTQLKTDQQVVIEANPVLGWKVGRFYVTDGEDFVYERIISQSDNSVIETYTIPGFTEGITITISVDFVKIDFPFTTNILPPPGYSGSITSVTVSNTAVNLVKLDDEVTVRVEPSAGWKLNLIEMVATPLQGDATNATAVLESGDDPRYGTFTMEAFPFGTTIVINVTFIKITHSFTPSVTPTGSGAVAIKVNDNTVTGTVNAQLDDVIAVTVNPANGWQINRITFTGMPLTGSAATLTKEFADTDYNQQEWSFDIPALPVGTVVTMVVEFTRLKHEITILGFTHTTYSGAQLGETTSVRVNSVPVTPVPEKIMAEQGDIVEITVTPKDGWRTTNIQTNQGMTVTNGTGTVHGPRTASFIMGGFVFGTEINLTTEFEKLTHIVTPSVTPTGSGTVAMQVNSSTPVTGAVNAQLDDSITVTVNPNAGWRITGMTLTGGTFTMTVPLSDGVSNNNYGVRSGTFTMPGFSFGTTVTVTVAFERIIHTFTPTIDPNVTPVSGSYTFSINDGAFQPAGPINAQLGDTISIRAAPAVGWKVKDIITTPAMTAQPWVGDEYDTRTRTFTMGGYTYDTSIFVTVEFEKLTHEINTSITPESNGTLTSITDVNNNPITNAQLDDVVKVTVEPKDGWRITGMTLTGGTFTMTIPLSNGVGNNNYGARTGTFTMPGFLYDTTVTVTVAFEKITHTFTPIVSPVVNPVSGSYTFSRNGGGSQTGQISAELGDEISISAAPAVGWKVKDIIISPVMQTQPWTGGEYDTRTLTFTMGAYPYDEEIFVTVEFEKLTHTLIANIHPNISGKISSFKVGTGEAVVVDDIETEINAQLNDLITITAEPGVSWEVVGVSTFVDGEPADIGVSFDENDVDEYGVATIIFEMRAFPVGTEIEVTVEFDSLEHVINIEAGPGGEITVVKVDNEEVSGEDRKAKTPSFIDVTAVPDTGYRVSSMIFTGIPLDGDTITYTHTWTAAEPGERTGRFTMPPLPFGTVVTIKAEFEKIIHSFNASITPSASGNYSFVVTDEAGTTYDYGTGGTITARLGDTVTITANPANTSTYRTSIITAVVNTGNGPESITVSGVNADPVTGVASGSFVMGAYPAGSTISLNVTFERIYTITANLSPINNGGTVSVATETADTTRAGQGEEITITASPHEGWKVTAITVNSSGSTLSQNEYGPRTLNFTMPANNVTVTATFEKIWYPINKMSVNSSEGSFTVRVGTESFERNPLRANYDDTINVNAVPEPGWRVKEIKAEAVPADTNEDTVSINVAPSSGNGPMTGTFNMTSYEPDTVIRITVEFEKLKHIINTSITPESNGTLTSITNASDVSITNAELGDVVKVTVEPKDGWRITGMTLTGGTLTMTIPLSNGAGNNNYGSRTGTFTMPGFVFGTDVTVTVNFEKITHKFTPTVIPDVTPVGGYYTYTYNGIDFNQAGEISAEIGDSFSIMATPAAGWKVKDIITTPAMEANSLSGEEHGARTRTFTMGGYAYDTAISVTIEFEKLKHPINTSIASERGTLTSVTVNDNTTTNAELGDTVKVTVTPEDGWRITGMTLTGGTTITLSNGVGDENYGVRTGTFTMPGFTHDIDVTVTVAFEKITHKFTPTITPASDSGSYTFSINSGEENPAGEISAEIGDTFSIMATPAAGWKVKDIITNPAMTADQLTGEEHGARTRTFTMGGYAFDTEISVTVEFEKLKHPINTSIASESGMLTSITNASDVQITNAELDDVVKVTVTPNAGWKITGMTLTGGTTEITLSDGISDENYGVRTGTFTMPGFLYNADVRVTVDFEKITHKFTPVVTPDTTPASGSYTFSINGSEELPAGEIDAQLGDEISIIAAPAAGWKVKDIITSPAMTNVSWVGEEHDTRTCTFTMGAFPYDEVISVTVEFEKLTHEINTSITSESNGTLTSITDVDNNPITNAELDDTVKVTVTPEDGWRITGMTLTGGTTITLSNGVGDENYGVRTGTFTMPGFLYNADVRVTVAFEKITHKLTPVIISASGGGDFIIINGGDSSDVEINAELGDEISIIATPAAGWRVKAITIPSGMTNTLLTGDVNVESTSTFTMGAFPYDAEISVTVEFEKIPYTINKTINNAAGGSFTVTIGEEATERLTAYYDETISVNITPLAGYMVTGWTAVSSDSGIDASGVESGTFEMSVLEPDSAITVTVGFEKIQYAIEKVVTDADSNQSWFTVTAREQTEHLLFDDQNVTIADISEMNFRFKADTLSVVAVLPDSGDTEDISLTGNTFNMRAFPEGTVIKVTVEFEQTYAIDIPAPENGSRTITTGTSDTTRAAAGENITIRAVPDANYRVENMNISSEPSAALNWTKTFIAGNANGTAGVVNGTFTMPTSDVTGYVTFVLTYSITGANTAPVSINGTPHTTSPVRGAAGDIVVMNATPPNNAQRVSTFRATYAPSNTPLPISWILTGGVRATGIANEAVPGTFIMPNGNVTITVESASINLNINFTENARLGDATAISNHQTNNAFGAYKIVIGHVTDLISWNYDTLPDRSGARGSDQISIITKPNAGYEVSNITLSSGSVNRIQDNIAVFNFNNTATTVTVTFEEIPEPDPSPNISMSFNTGRSAGSTPVDNRSSIFNFGSGLTTSSLMGRNAQTQNNRTMPLSNIPSANADINETNEQTAISGISAAPERGRNFSSGWMERNNPAVQNRVETENAVTDNQSIIPESTITSEQTNEVTITGTDIITDVIQEKLKDSPVHGSILNPNDTTGKIDEPKNNIARIFIFSALGLLMLLGVFIVLRYRITKSKNQITDNNEQ